MKTQAWLGALLALQLILAAGLFLGGRPADPEDMARPLLDFDVAAVERVVIEDEFNTATLEKTDGGWRLPELGGLPGAGARIDSLLADLAALETGFPVATSSSALERFAVTEDNYQRRLRLYQGGELLGEYFFGTSPSFRQTHGRRASDGEVYSLDINNFDLPGDNNDWLDKNLLAAAGAARIEGPDYTLEKSEEAWRLVPAEGLETEGELQQASASALAAALASLRVLRAAEDVPETLSAALAVQAGDDTWRYEFLRDEDENRYYVRRDDVDTAFTISQTTYDTLAGTDLNSLLGIEEPPKEEEQEESPKS